SWPGNLRELHHITRTIVLFCEGTEVQPAHVVFQPSLYASNHSETDPPAAAGPNLALADGKLSLADALQRHVRAVYERTGRNQRQTARLLEISRSRLARHLRTMGSK
ncbi:MAG TPA: hypothetical protein VN794_04945, partial [Methylomirabilota bacterium]|nr:hypothetical protein [Methylomirabilota bacterium]